MKVGSLVVCVNPFNGDEQSKPLVKDKIYTIRRFDNYKGSTAIMLEEIINNQFLYEQVLDEPAYKIDRFREIDCPQSICIEEIIELEGA